MLQSFTNDINQIRPCEILNDRAGIESDPNVAITFLISKRNQ